MGLAPTRQESPNVPLNLTALRPSVEPGPWQAAPDRETEGEMRLAAPYEGDTWEPSWRDPNPGAYHISQYPGDTNPNERTRNNGNCGPVATLMALKAFGVVNPSPTEVDGMISELRRRGGATREERVGFRSATSADQLARAARSYGLTAAPAWGQRLPAVEAALVEGKLVIALVRPGAYTRSSSTGHWVLVTGIENGKVLVNDPALHVPSRAIDARQFARALALKGGTVGIVGDARTPC